MHTQKKLLLLTFFSVSLFSHRELFAQTSIQPGKVNLATLVVDYDTGLFEHGNLSYYECSSELCSNETLPFIVNYFPPGDIGGIKFSLPTIGIDNQAFFDASIIWMGTGEISKSTSFSSDYPFTIQGQNMLFPNNIIAYYDEVGNITNDAVFISLANPALSKVANLAVAGLFGVYDYQIGVYLYTPAVGITDFSVAKWVIFLYSNAVGTNAVDELTENKFMLYPNPVSDELNVVSNEKVNSCSFEIQSLSGQTIRKGELTNNQKVDVSNLENGFYILTFYDDKANFSHTQKFLVEK